jgi:hypothetical protein
MERRGYPPRFAHRRQRALFQTQYLAQCGLGHVGVPASLGKEHQHDTVIAKARAGLELLKPAANDVLQRWPVSKRVNSRGPATRMQR